MPTLIRNSKSQGSLSLPWPLRGTLAAGASVLVTGTVEEVTALLGPSAAAFELVDGEGLPSSYWTDPWVAPTAEVPPEALDPIPPDALEAAAALPGTGAVGVAGTPFTIYAPFAAGAGGAAGDVLITDDLPFACRLLNVALQLTTGVDASTATLRNAAAAGGDALSAAIATAVANAGTVQQGNIGTSIPLLAAGSDLYLRRSDTGIAGAVVLTLMRV